jgi:uncharacterized membrane protein
MMMLSHPDRQCEFNGWITMIFLVLGLVLFLGVHSVRIFAPQWRDAQLATRGERSWKALYSGAAIIGFAVLVYGYGLARESTDIVYLPPEWGRSVLHVAMPIALVLIVASQLPQGNLKKRFAHPMLWGVIIWSVAHLLANGNAASVVLFGAILVWAIVNLHSARQRNGPESQAAVVWPDLVSLLVGFVLTAAFVAFLHQWLIGVPVM